MTGRRIAAPALPSPLETYYMTRHATIEPMEDDGDYSYLKSAKSRLLSELGGYVAEWEDGSGYMRHVIFEGPHLTDEHLHLLDGETHLSSLAFRNSAISGSALVRLQGLDDLQSFSSMGSRHVDRDLGFLARLPQLSSVRLWGGFSGEAVSRVVAPENLVFIDLRDSEVTESGAAAMGRCTRLTQLGLERCRLPSSGLSFVREMRSLQALNAAGSNLDDGDLHYLDGLKKLRNLQIDGTNVSDDGIERIAGAPGLKQLSLRGCRTTVRSLDRLRDRLDLTVLAEGTAAAPGEYFAFEMGRRIRMRPPFASLAEQGARFEILADARRVNLFLTGPQFTDAVVQKHGRVLAQQFSGDGIPDAPLFQGVYFTGSPITDAAIDGLLAQVSLDALARIALIDFTDTHVSPRAIARLRGLVPSVEIHGTAPRAE